MRLQDLNFNNSLAIKIFVSLFFVALIPFYILLYYIYLHNLEQLRSQLTNRYQNELNQITLNIKNDLEELEKESAFMAALPLMDEIISDDIDKRLLQLIELKAKVFKLPLQLTIVNRDNNIIASTQNNAIKGDMIRFKHTIYATFNPSMPIGTLLIELPLSSLSYYFKTLNIPYKIAHKRSHIATNSATFFLQQHIDKYNLELLLFPDKEQMFAPLQLLKTELLLIALGTFGLFIALFIAISYIISKPISENIALQQQRLLLLEEAKHAAETKSRFISQMSHEFRTPLNSIIGFSQFLDQEQLVESSYAKLPKNIEKAGKHLLDLVNSMLEFAKMQSTHIAIHKENFRINTVIEDVITLLEADATKKGLTLTCNHGDFSLYSDKAVVKNIIINLVANGIKFTHEGHVHVEIYKPKVTITDSGIGIKHEDVDKLFTPFERFDNAKNIEGSGLGLALSHAYALQLGITLTYIPQKHGSAFCLDFSQGLEGENISS